MGVYIKGMEMPERCEKCFMCQSDCMGCKVTQNFIILKKGQNKPSWCPLVEVPPHGRLIDAFAFRREMDTKYPFDKFTQSEHGEADAAKSTILMMLVKAPTIIEAEGNQ